jgi:integrase/recombinase XerC
MKELKEKFLNYLHVMRNASPHTVRNYGLDLDDFEAFAKVEVAQVTKSTVRAYLAHLNACGAKERTILRRLSTLRSFFLHLIKEKIVVQNPLDEIEAPKL